MSDETAPLVEAPTALLRRAADKLRDLAGDATRGPWFAEHPAERWGESKDAELVGGGKPLAMLRYDHNGHLNADYIEAIQPAVGAALAELLTAAADMAEAYPEMAHDHDRPACADYACDMMGRAIDAARALLGEAS